MHACVPDPVRRALCAALPLLAARALRAADALPARNLNVEVRVVEAATADTAATVAGAVGVDSRGTVRATGAVRTLGATQHAGQRMQAVRVLNGGYARMQMVRTQALTGAVATWSEHRPGQGRPPSGPPPWGPPGSRPPPGGGPGGAVVTAWAELVDGFEVQPRWPGGDAPVTVAIGAMRAAGAAGAHALPRQFDLFTTVQAPLGEWTELARVERVGSATVSSGNTTVGTQQAWQMQLRVTLAD